MRRLKGRKIRVAAVAVELAVCAPVMFAMLFGIIEFGWLFTVRHTMVNAAREGARFGSLEGVEAADVEARVRELLDTMSLSTHASVNIEEATTEDPIVTVEVTIPQESVSLVGDFFNLNMGTLRGVAAMRKEGM